ncbi:hypothetical protein [Luteolibacter sp. AS25]|uniref:hypothetical protein n=1 Tax=Luteolibacter sp. AS25 TaxID=3135776 RepID=UPI00398A8E8B
MSARKLLLGLVTLSTPLTAADFLEPYEHSHFSGNGTPVIHTFGIEPALTGRDLFLDYTYVDGDGGSEQEIELELEWAFTRRLGIIVEVPYIFENETGGPSASGIGDLALVPRALLIDSDQFLLTGQIETVVPTGSSTFGGETAIAPGIATWNDLGNWFALNTQVGVEHVFDEDSTEFFIGLGLVKSFGDRPDLHTDHTGHDHAHQHPTTAGLINLHLELNGSTPLNGEEQGDINLDGLIGISYGLTELTDIRLAYQFPITSPKEFDHAITSGLIWHF